jgi:hydroxypyruvate reductase
LDDKRAVTASLLKCGATIAEINTVRKHLSAIKGGRLAAAASPARVVTLVISDVPGDEPATVASGPTLPDPTTFAEARAVLAKYRIDVPEEVRRRLEGLSDETPKRLDHTEAIVIARAADALQAAAAHARSLGIEPAILGDDLQGEAAQLGTKHAELAREASGPRVILSGGETTVALTGPAGRGGRNTEYLLSLGLALDGTKGIFALAADTDGLDGDAAAAGAILRPGSLVAARSLGLDPRAMASRHDSAAMFAALGDLIVTGPTRTNVNDFRAILILH